MLETLAHISMCIVGVGALFEIAHGAVRRYHAMQHEAQCRLAREGKRPCPFEDQHEAMKGVSGVRLPCCGCGKIL